MAETTEIQDAAPVAAPMTPAPAPKKAAPRKRASRKAAPRKAAVKKTAEKPQKATMSNRGKRKGGRSLGGYNYKLSVPEGVIPEDREAHWFNDDGNRIQEKINNDWEFMYNDGNIHVGDGGVDQNTDIGSKISMVVGSDKQGNPMRGYLMMKWKDWHKADEAKKQERPDEIDKALRNPGFGADEKGVAKEGLYGKVDIKTNYKA